MKIDVILLTGPDINSVPRQGKRVWLMENGHVISGFQLQKEWSECVLEACLKEAFEEKIPDGVDFEIPHARPQDLGETDSCSWSSSKRRNGAQNI